MTRTTTIYIYKMAALHNYFHSTITIREDPNDKKKETNITEQTAINNNYEPKIVDINMYLMNRIIQRKMTNTTNTSTQIKY